LGKGIEKGGQVGKWQVGEWAESEIILIIYAFLNSFYQVA
jgi:hypothetical protein